MLVELAFRHLLRRGHDGVAERLVEPAERHVGLGRRAFHDAERAHDGERLALPADLEVAERALGLRPPVFVGGDLDRPEGVGLGAGWLLLGRRWGGHAVVPVGNFQFTPQ